MENKYFIAVNGQQQGPFSEAQLSSQNISPETLVWYQGLATWTPASQLPELAHLFVQTQPAYQQPAQPAYQHPAQPAYQQPAQPAYQYFIAINGQQLGPIDPSLFSQYGVTADTMVWREGMASWQPAHILPELAPYININAQPVQSYGQQPSQPYGQPGYGQQPGGVPAQQHTNWLPWAITATILGFLCGCLGMICGIVGWVYASKANEYYAAGQTVLGDDKNTSAKTWTIIALVLVGIGAICSFFYMGAVMAALESL
ncbi:MAG: GYF domain-containing protein [Clostridium sp.]|nr:GYF domain-containing protein [Prevotella sp.]MCM1428902.1 GYF domain-containing protein [Clostridium sp.]